MWQISRKVMLGTCICILSFSVSACFNKERPRTNFILISKSAVLTKNAVVTNSTDKTVIRPDRNYPDTSSSEPCHPDGGVNARIKIDQGIDITNPDVTTSAHSSVKIPNCF